MNYTTTCALCASMFTGSKAECKARKCRQCLQLEKRTGAVAIVPDSEPTGIEAAVCADITARQQLGIRKYGCTVAESKDDMLRHALEESYDLAVYLRAEIERRKTQSWQPIESAPTDGTEVLVYRECATVPIVHLAWYRSEEEWEREGQFVGGFDNLDEWQGWWSYTQNSVTQEKIEPTHWMAYTPPTEKP